MQAISSFTAAYDTFPFAIPLDDSEIEVISSSGEVADGVAVRDGVGVCARSVKLRALCTRNCRL